MKKTMWMVTATMLLASSLASAQPMGGGPGEREGHPVFGRFMQAIHRLDLSDSQRDLIHGVMEDMEAELAGIADREEERPAFMEYFCSSEFNSREFESMLGERLEKMRLANGIIAGALAEIHGILTREQLDELAAMREEHGRRLEERHCPGEGMAPPHRGMR
ncbi:MAG: Spy/CpxP family protein refolding chaperone [Candidatus Fermentibacteraceae bacterium]